MTVTPVHLSAGAEDEDRATRGRHGAAALIDPLTIASAALAVSRRDDKVECLACAHRCVIAPGRRGACKVRHNEGGSLRVPWNRRRQNFDRHAAYVVVAFVAGG
jgi:hypothetical protein